jgi:hypothetical protein
MSMQVTKTRMFPCGGVGRTHPVLKIAWPSSQFFPP